MDKEILYLGDLSCPGPAGYLVGVMSHYNLIFNHIADNEKPSKHQLENSSLFVLSDYSADKLTANQLELIYRSIENGAGILMIGGWDSFHGRNGYWHNTPIAELLPVKINDHDDRKNCAQPTLIKKVMDHSIVEDLPFETPPTIGGYNTFKAKPDTKTILEGERFITRYQNNSAQFTPAGSFPLLVVDEEASSRRACLATDVAPHWVGGLVDWGDERLTLEFKGGFVEVGNHYARFFSNLLIWCLGR